MSEPTSIGGDWVSVVDPASGRTYYANVVTGSTSWTYPEELQPQASSIAPPPAPSEWIEATDPASGRVYYVNTATNQTQWEPPAGWSATQQQPSQAGQPSSAGAAETSSVEVLMSNWRSILDFVRPKATQAIAEKAKFSKLREFADMSAKKKDDVSAKRHAKQAQIAEEKKAASAAAEKEASLTIREMLDVKVDESSIETRNMDGYAEEHFNLNRKGMFGKRTTVTKILSWKADVIKTSLRKMPTKELGTSATQCFRNITGFMGDRTSRKEDGGHAEKLLQTCLNAPEELRDEVYCQLIKQTTNNPNQEALLKGWQLIGLCSGVFPSSEEFYPYLLSYCKKHFDSDSTVIGDYARYSTGRLSKSIDLGPRREIPCSAEIEACKNMDPVLVRVYHMDGSFDVVPVTSWTTAKDLNKMMAHLLGIRSAKGFAVFELTPDMEERYLDEDERILDLVAYYQRLYEEEKQQQKKYEGTKLYRFAYKVHVYFDPPPSDVYAHREIYIQAVFDVVSGRYPCSEEDCIRLAGLQMQAEFHDSDSGLTVEQIKRYVPEKYLENPTKAANVLALCKEAHSKNNGTAPSKAQQEYMAFVKKWKIYGSSFFFVEPQNTVDLPEAVFLAVNPRGILIINPDTKEVLADHPYSEIPTWGHSGASFVLHVGNLIKQDKLYFHTQQGKDLNDLIHMYVNWLCS